MEAKPRPAPPGPAHSPAPCPLPSLSLSPSLPPHPRSPQVRTVSPEVLLQMVHETGCTEGLALGWGGGGAREG